MSPIKKVIVTVLAAMLLVAASVGFANLFLPKLTSQVDSEKRREAYPRPVPVETQLETSAPPETEPPTLPVETEPEEVRTSYPSVPLYHMTDYPDILYRSGTVATSGSNITCLAMVASYLTGYDYTPDKLANYFATYIGTTHGWLEHVSDELQLPWKRAVNFHESQKALEEGKIVIAMMSSESYFGDRCVVLTGINEAGLITVNDPDPTHQDQWNLQKGLAEGFEGTVFLKGYRASWIYDPAQMPEEPFRYEPEENTDEFRYPGVELTQAEKDLMAKLIYAEARSEPFEGQQAIAEVILNRLVADNFPDTISKILNAADQFKGMENIHLADPSHTQYVAIERALNGPYVVPIDVVFFATFPASNSPWGTIGAHTFCYQWDYEGS